MQAKGTTKRCGTCRAVKDVGEFGKAKRYADGLNYLCSECSRRKSREVRQRVRETDRQRPCPSCSVMCRAGRYCDPCKAAKVLADYYADHDANREAARVRNTAWREANRGRSNAYQRAWAAANSDKVVAARRAWKQSNPDALAAERHRRRARLAGVDHEPYDRSDIIARDRSRCWMCGKKCSGRDLTLDHLLPISLGGADAGHNLAVACRSCNSAKRDRLIPFEPMMFG